MEFCQQNALTIANTLFQQYKRRLYTWILPDGQHQIRLITFFVANDLAAAAGKDGEPLYSQQNKTRS